MSMQHGGPPHLEGAKPSRASERKRLASLAAVITASFGVGLAFGLGFALTALTFESWNTPKWLIGIAGAAPALGVLSTLPFLARVVTGWGLVRAITFGCLVGALGFLALGLIPDPYAWVVIRYLMCAGLALPWLAGETWINTVTREETRGRVIALYAISFFSGYTAGPLLLDYSGLSGMLPSAFGAASMAIAGLPIILASRLAPDISSKEGERAKGLLAASRLAPVGMASGLISGFAEMSYLALIGNVAMSAGMTQTQALHLMSFMTFGGVALQFPIGWLADKWSRTGVTLGLGVLFIALSLALPTVLGTGDAAYAIAFLLGGVVLGFYTVGLAIVGEEVDLGDLAAANAAFLVMYQLGGIVGPAAAGLAMTASPVTGFVETMVAIMAAAIIAVFFLGRRRS